jgi:hypothetical protein
VNRRCWVPLVAACPHCAESLRIVGGSAALRADTERKFRARHFDSCRSNPARHPASICEGACP